MTRRSLLALLSSIPIAKAQNCAIAPNVPSGFIGPIPPVDFTRAVTGFQRPYDSTDTDTGFAYEETAPLSAYPSCTHGPIHHPGKDINTGVGSWGDFGSPVYAAADGFVSYVRPTASNINPLTKATYTVGEWIKANQSRFAVAPPPSALDNTELFQEFTGANSWVGVILGHVYMGSIYYSLYGHVIQVDRTVLEPGKIVCKGTQIAKIGVIGANSSHLHFEIRKSTHPHMPTKVTDYFGFCENISNAYVDEYYYNPIDFVDSHPDYNTLILKEISGGVAVDSRFGPQIGNLELQVQLPFLYPGLEVRAVPFTFSGGRTVVVYHFLDIHSEQSRTAVFYDPDVAAFQTLSTPHLA